MSFFKAKPKIPVSLICDLSPHSIGLALIKLSPDAKPQIIFAKREYISYRHKPTGRHILSKMIPVIDGLLKDHLRPFLYSDQNIEYSLNISCIHSLAWSFERAKKVVLHSPNPIEVTSKLIDSIMAKEVEQKNIEVKKEGNIDGLICTNRRFSHVMLNGYEVLNPWGQTAIEVSTFIMQSLVDKRMIDFSNSYLANLSSEGVHHITEAEAIFSGLRKIYPESNTSVIVFAGGETTDLFKVENGNIIESISFPHGIATLVRAISEANHKDDAVAFSHLNQILAKVRIPTKKESVQIAESIDLLNKHFQKSLFELGFNHIPPKQVFMLSALHHFDLAKHIYSPKTFIYEGESETKIFYPLEHSDFDKKALYADGVSHDPLLCLESFCLAEYQPK